MSDLGLELDKKQRGGEMDSAKRESAGEGQDVYASGTNTELLPVVQSVLNHQALMADVVNAYEIGTPVTCELILTRQNDTYLLRTREEALIVRLYNTLPAPQNVRVDFFGPIEGAALTDMMERPLPDQSGITWRVTSEQRAEIGFPLRPFGIATVRMEVEPAEERLWPQVSY